MPVTLATQAANPNLQAAASKRAANYRHAQCCRNCPLNERGYCVQHRCKTINTAVCDNFRGPINEQGSTSAQHDQLGGQL